MYESTHLFRVSLALDTMAYLIFANFEGKNTVLDCCIVCISLTVSEVENLLMNLLTIRIPSSVTCLLQHFHIFLSTCFLLFDL